MHCDLLMFAKTVLDLVEKLEDQLELTNQQQNARYAAMQIRGIKAELERNAYHGIEETRDQNELGKAPYE